jgi:hypothetical protein
MPIVEPSVIANAVMGKIYDVLTNGDETVPKSADNFFSWCTPGIPVEPADLEFLTQGLTGVVKKKAVEALGAAPGQDPATTASTRLTDEERNQLLAQDTAGLYMQAENLARLMDFVPDVATGTNGQFAKMAVQNNDGSLSDVYDYTLRMSQVMKTELPEELKAKLEKFRKLMQKVVKKKNLITDEEVETIEPSDLQNAYMAKMAAYDEAALQYNARRIDALTAADPRAVHDWAINANVYRNRVRAAMNDWVVNGFKQDYEAIAAAISQVTRRDMALLKQAYVEDFERARLTGLASGSDFFFTSLVPGNFANSTGWTRFTFSGSEVQSRSNSSFNTSSWRARGGGGFLGIFGGGGGGSGSSTHREFHSSFESSRTSMTFEVAQIPIARPWFRPAFLTGHGWRFDQNNVLTRTDKLSDGGAPPNGKMPAYATSAIFVRKLALDFGESSGFSDFVSDVSRSSADAGGYVSFGPFFLGGSYSRSSASGSKTHNWGYKTSNNGIAVDGMQIIGFKCHVMPKSPDPDPSIPASAWI